MSEHRWHDYRKQVSRLDDKTIHVRWGNLLDRCLDESPGGDSHRKQDIVEREWKRRGGTHDGLLDPWLGGVR